jgi:hypothetical protein
MAGRRFTKPVAPEAGVAILISDKVDIKLILAK